MKFYPLEICKINVTGSHNSLFCKRWEQRQIYLWESYILLSFLENASNNYYWIFLSIGYLWLFMNFYAYIQIKVLYHWSNFFQGKRSILTSFGWLLHLLIVENPKCLPWTFVKETAVMFSLGGAKPITFLPHPS